jgi:hypothetical protein
MPEVDGLVAGYGFLPRVQGERRNPTSSCQDKSTNRDCGASQGCLRRAGRSVFFSRIADKRCQLHRLPRRVALTLSLQLTCQRAAEHFIRMLRDDLHLRSWAYVACPILSAKLPIFCSRRNSVAFFRLAS